MTEMAQILRQYALLASILHKVFSHSSGNNTGTPSAKSTKTTDPSNHFSGSLLSGTHVSVLTNHDPTEDRLDFLLNDSLGDVPQDSMDLSVDEDPYSLGPSKDPEDLKIDITLRTQIGQSPMIMLLFPVEREGPQGVTLPSGRNNVRMASLNIEIGLNGRISVDQIQGLSGIEETDHGNGPTPEVQELQTKLAKVLETSEDLGILVEWIHRWMRRRKDRA